MNIIFFQDGDAETSWSIGGGAGAAGPWTIKYTTLICCDYMCIYIYTHTHNYVYTHIYVYTYIYIYIEREGAIYKYMYTHVYICMHV